MPADKAAPATSSGPWVATLAPLLTNLARLVLALVLVWIGLAKCVPGWNPGQVDSEQLMSLLTVGKVDGTVALMVVGGLQMLAGFCLAIPRLAGAAVTVLVLLFAMGVTLAILHWPILVGGAGGVTPNAVGTGLVKGLALHLAAMALAAAAAAKKA